NELPGVRSMFAPSRLWPRERDPPARSRRHSGVRRVRPGKKRSVWDCRLTPARSVLLNFSKLAPHHYEGGPILRTTLRLPAPKSKCQQNERTRSHQLPNIVEVVSDLFVASRL